MRGRFPKGRDPVHQAAYDRAWRKAHPEHVRRWNLRQKAKVLQLLGGATCVVCGCNDVRALEVNHIGGGGGKESLARGRIGSLYGRILSGRRTTEDLNVLCRPCNAADYIYRKSPAPSGRWEIEWIPEPHLS